MIKMQIIGNLGRDAEVHTHGGEIVVNFSVAHTDKNKDANGQVVHKATWVSCSWWTDRQAIVQYLKKGQMVWIEGVPEAKLWKDKKSGEAKAFLNMRVLGLQLVGMNNTDSGGQPATQHAVPQAQQGYVPVQTGIDDDSSLPF